MTAGHRSYLALTAQEVISPARFDRHHGKGAFLRLCAMLADPTFAYQQIGNVFGVTRQSIFLIAKKLGVDGMQRRHPCERGAMRYSSAFRIEVFTVWVRIRSS